MIDQGYSRVFLQRRLDYRVLLIDEDLNSWILFDLTPQQENKIPALTCYRSFDLCEQHLKRPHLTCLSCDLRKAVTGQIPLLQKVHIHQIWWNNDLPQWKTKIIKSLCSLLETTINI